MNYSGHYLQRQSRRAHPTARALTTALLRPADRSLRNADHITFSNPWYILLINM